MSYMYTNSWSHWKRQKNSMQNNIILCGICFTYCNVKIQIRGFLIRMCFLCYWQLIIEFFFLYQWVNQLIFIWHQKRLAKSGAQHIPIGILMVCLCKVLPNSTRILSINLSRKCRDKIVQYMYYLYISEKTRRLYECLQKKSFLKPWRQVLFSLVGLSEDITSLVSLTATNRRFFSNRGYAC